MCKLWYGVGKGMLLSGKEDGVCGVGVMGEELCGKVVEVRRMGDRLMAVVLVFYEDVLKLICRYTLQCGNLEEKQSYYDQRPNLKDILIHINVNSNSTKLTANFKCFTKRCQICNLIDIRPFVAMQVMISIVKPGSFSCSVFNVMQKCCNGEDNYIGEMSRKFPF